MIVPRVSNCKECAEIMPLIDAINCKLYEASVDMYNNIAYALNHRTPVTDLLDLLHYKRILMNKYVDMNYACDFTINQIANRVRILTAGCAKCVHKEVIKVFHPLPNLCPTTTTTTTPGPTTTTSTTVVPTTTSTTTLVPTTTTTTTGFPIGFSSGFGDPNVCCQFGSVNQNNWYANTPTIDVGVRIYTDPALTFPLTIAGSNYYKYQGAAWTISGTGFITTKFTCP
jgi:hypothetical protein